MNNLVNSLIFVHKICVLFSIFDVHAAKEIVGNDVDGGGIRVGGMCGMIANATEETTAFHYYIDVGGHEELDAATESVDVDFLILGDDGLAQVHADATAESIETGTMERLTMIDVLVATVFYSTTDALAILADRQRATKPLIGVAAVAVDDGGRTHVQQ